MIEDVHVRNPQRKQLLSNKNICVPEDLQRAPGQSSETLGTKAEMFWKKIQHLNIIQTVKHHDLLWLCCLTGWNVSIMEGRLIPTLAEVSSVITSTS